MKLVFCSYILSHLLFILWEVTLNHWADNNPLWAGCGPWAGICTIQVKPCRRHLTKKLSLFTPSVFGLYCDVSGLNANIEYWSELISELA